MRARVFPWPALAIVGLLVSGGCTAILDLDADQCRVDSDCDHFQSPGLICKERVCALGPAGCGETSPESTVEYLNQCTAASCTPIDNCARFGLCDGTLPALIAPPP